MTVPLRYPVDALVSYHYFRDDDKMQAVTAGNRLRLIADSGAFSAFTQGSKIKLPDYAAWLQRWWRHLFWAAALDVFGDPQATHRNWASLRDDHGLPTAPSLHIGDNPAFLDWYAREGVDFVGLGGMVGMPRPNILRWLVHVLRYARDRHPGMRFHGWGMNTYTILEKLPLYSVDSSGLLSQAYRYARLTVWDPRTRANVAMRLDGRTPFRHHQLLRDTYGVAPADVARPGPSNRSLLIKISAASIQFRAAALQARHRVSPPTWGIDTLAPGGTHLHVAETSTRDFAPLVGPRLHILDRDPWHMATPSSREDQP